MSYERAKGRNKTERFVALPYYLLNSDTYTSLSSGAKVAYIEIKKRYNGMNNGEIAYAIRDLAKRMNCSNNSASKYIQELINHGFIKYRQKGAFNCKVRIASEFILTEYDYNGKKATKDFMKWEPDKT